MNGHDNGTTVFLEILPKVRKHALFAFRCVRDPNTLDDRVQETLAISWLWCCRLWARGKDAREFPTTLATYATRHVKSGRTFVGTKRLTKDPLSPLAQAMRGFRTDILPSLEPPVGSPWQTALIDNTQSPPDEQAAFRIDFPAWLDSLSDRDRQITQDMTMGDTTQELSARHHLSPGRISQLRREFMDDWHTFTAEQA